MNRDTIWGIRIKTTEGSSAAFFFFYFFIMIIQENGDLIFFANTNCVDLYWVAVPNQTHLII